MKGETAAGLPDEEAVADEAIYASASAAGFAHPHRLGLEAVLRRYSQRVRTQSTASSEYDPTYSNVNELRPFNNSECCKLCLNDFFFRIIKKSCRISLSVQFLISLSPVPLTALFYREFSR